jgi:hypothetical protein
MTMIQMSHSGPPPAAAPSHRLRALARRIRARLPVYLADLRDDPKWLLMFISGRIVMVRRAVSLMTRSAVPQNASSDTIFAGIDPRAAAAEIRTDGISCGLQLPEPIVRGIRAFADRTECFGNLERSVAFLPAQHREAEIASGQPILVGHFLDKIEQCPEIDIVRQDPCLLLIASHYLRTTAVVISSRLWWSFPSENYDEALLKRASQERFHFDMNDWRSVKFFFYLTDVDDDAGPHVYVRESHRRKRLRHQLTFFVGKPDGEIIDFYGRERIMRIHGPAGYGFAEDPFGFHMGTVALRRPRLMFEVEYGISPPTRRRFYGDLPTRSAQAPEPK